MQQPVDYQPAQYYPVQQPALQAFQPDQKLPFKVWKYTLMRTLVQLSSIATMIMFIVAQTKFPGYFLGSIIYSALSIFNFVFMCLSHEKKLGFMTNYLFFIVLLVLCLAPAIWNIVYLTDIAKDCGYINNYYCALELTTTLPHLGWGLFAAFVIQESLFITYFMAYKRDQDEVKAGNSVGQGFAAQAYPGQAGYAPVVAGNHLN